MSFIHRFHFYQPKPTKGYLYNYGVMDAFYNDLPVLRDGKQIRSGNGCTSAGNTKRYLEHIVIENNKIFDDASFLIAILWGDDGVKVADVFGYAKTEEWPGNPEVSNWVFRDGVYLPNPNYITCSNSIRMLGMEENARRGTKSLEEYMKLNPFLGDLQPIQG